MSLRKDIEGKFSTRIFDHGLFYLFEGSLRFELSTGDNAIEMFSVAYEKSQEILHDIFKNELSIVVCWSFYGKSRLTASLSLFKELLDLGIKIPKAREMWSVEDDEDEAVYRHFILFELDLKFLRNLIWGTMAQDIGIWPQLPGSVYIYGKSCGILAQPYDDRGMDLVAEKGRTLDSVYKKYNHYLLDYDREEMDRVYKNS